MTRATTKLFRGEALPKFAMEEVASKKRYRQRLLASEGAGAVHLRYRKSRWDRLGFDLEGMSTREIFCWLEFASQRVGAFKFLEYRADDYLDNEAFFELMDSYTGNASDLASTLTEHWEEAADLLDYGSILEFHAAWTDAQLCPKGVWSIAANQLIARHCPDYSILVLKAFPLEYENNENDKLTASREHRQEAMRRHYRRLLGVAAFPKDREWMYRINPKFLAFIDAPSVSETMPPLDALSKSNCEQ